MKILALETSGRLGSVALLEAERDSISWTLERATPADQQTARSLIPTTQTLLAEAGWRPADVQLVAVATGPGSFTGLRIGVVAAKTLAYAVGAQLVGVHTLVAMAEPLQNGAAPLWTILDAQRQELFVSRFEPLAELSSDSAPTTEIVPIDRWLAQLSSGDVVAGPPLEKLQAKLPTGIVVAERQFWNPSAAAVGRLGFLQCQAGRLCSPLELVPNYFRRSAAEEKAAAAAAR